MNRGKWQTFNHAKLKISLEQAAEKTADALIVVYRHLKAILRKIPKGIFHFFRFFLYINWTTLKEVVICTAEQRLNGLSAEMAYNSTLALFPALLSIIAAISLSDSLQNTLQEMGTLLAVVVPQEVQVQISTVWERMLITRSEELFSFSFLVSIWLFSGVIGSAMVALNHIHRVPRERLRRFWEDKLIAIALAIGTILLLVVACGLVFISDVVVEILARKSCILETVGTCPLDQIKDCLEQPPVQQCLLLKTLPSTWRQLRWPIALGIVATNFALIYRFGPSQREPETPLVPGAILAAILWAVISNLFRLYVTHFGNYNITYGAIGAFIILLLWLYIASLVMLIGAQVNVTVGEAMRRRKSQASLPSSLR
ncbi:YihY/virulence factor BrkB family protein [Limnoraphis robusta Tam1]|uniref:YihY/virulence factor BrkB family protein n=1 Tax=Limnoraphis robusta TaxID=1118279 RepID=UPI002B20EE77|nr:YihY/virulence factor BrkB family protein [Limnoraphis robusta]MEA5538720.1 YihY/virulence factor BrkB family protein [Limnoraphis robusta Tam1]